MNIYHITFSKPILLNILLFSSHYKPQLRHINSIMDSIPLYYLYYLLSQLDDKKIRNNIKNKKKKVDNKKK